MKRFLSVLLALVMALSMLPMSALAAKFTYDGIEVDLEYGKQIDPNKVLGAYTYEVDGVDVPVYDIKAVGGIQVSTESNGVDANGIPQYKLNAEGVLQLYIPFAKIESMVDEKIMSYINPAIEMFEKKKDDALRQPITKEDLKDLTYEVEYKGVPVSASPNFSGKLEDLIRLISAGEVEVAGTASGESFTKKVTLSDAEKYEALMKIADTAASVLDITLVKTGAPGTAYRRWRESAATPGCDAAGLAEQLCYVLGTKYIQEFSSLSDAELPEGFDSAKAAMVGTLFGTLQYYNQSGFNGDFLSVADMKTQLETVPLSQIKSLLALDTFLSAVKGFLYGPLNDEVSLSLRIEYVETELTALKNRFGEKFAGVSFNFSLPTDDVVQLEGTLAKFVEKINGAPGTITGKICGAEAGDKLDEVGPTGMYAVVGVDYFERNEEFKEKLILPYVIAPEVVPVTLKNNGEGIGPYLHVAADEVAGVNIEASVPATATGTLMQPRYIGVQTDGDLYDSDNLNGAMPTEPGVYTVFAIYLDEATLSMGADVAVLVIEPKAANDFAFTGDTEFKYDGTAKFPATTGGYETLKVASDDQGDVYVKLPENIIGISGAAVSWGENKYNVVVDKLAEDYSLILPQRLTAMVADVLVQLHKAAEQDDRVADVTAAQAKAVLYDYIGKVKAEVGYNNGASFKANLVEKFTAAVDKVEAKIEGSATVEHYKGLVSSGLEEFKNLMNSGTEQQTFALGRGITGNDDVDAVIEKFLEKAMEELQAGKDDVKSLMTYLVAWVENSSYMQDAETLVKTLGAIGGMADTEVIPYVNAVKAAANTLKDEVVAKVNEIGTNVPTMQDAEDVLDDIIAFARAVLDQAYALVDAYDFDTLYFNMLPSAVGTYSCYAVNVSSNSMPKLIDTTMVIKTEDTPVVPPVQEDIAVTITAVNTSVENGPYGKNVELTYTQDGADGVKFDVTLSVIDKNGDPVTNSDLTKLAVGEYTIKVCVADKEGYDINTVDGKLNVCKISNEGVTLSLQGLLKMKLVFKPEGFSSDVDFEKQGGVVVWIGDEKVSNRNQLQVGAENCVTLRGDDAELVKATEVEGAWAVYSLGIPAKQYGETVYMRPFVEVAEGQYIYGGAGYKSPRAYCEEQLDKSISKDIKETLAALLKYGAAAQKLFDYDLDNLVDKNLEAANYNLAYNANMIDLPIRPTQDMANTLTGTKTGVGSAKATLSLDGGIIYKIIYANVTVDNIESAEVLFWTENGYLEADTLAYDAETYSYKAKLEYGTLFEGTSEEISGYIASSEMVPVKEIGDTIYFSARIVDKDGNVFRSGLSYYNADKFVNDKVLDSTTDSEIVEVAKALAVYCEKAKIMFSYKTN